MMEYCRRAIFFQRVHQLRDGRSLLADGDVDADQRFLGVAGLVDALLVDDGVDDHRGLAGLAVSDDQLALATANRDQGVDRLQAGLHRLMHRFARDDAGRLDFDAAHFGVGDRTLAIDRNAQTVDHAAEQAGTDRDFNDRAGARYRVAFTDITVVAEDHDADVVGFQVQRHAAEAGGRKFDHLAGHHVLQAEHAGDTIADRQDLARFGDIGFGIEGGDLLLQDLRDLGWADLHFRRLPSWRTAGVAAEISNWCRKGEPRSGRPGRQAGQHRRAHRY